jgi:hypothetical protein
MIETMFVPLLERLETAHTVRAAPSFLRRKFLKAFGKVLLAWDTNLALLLAAAVVALVSM